MFLPRPPLLLQWLFPSLIWHKHRGTRDIYLTFDDGPIPAVTEQVLNILKEHEAQATFFCIGDNVRKYPEVYEKILANGHAVGNHTFNHLRGWDHNVTDYLNNIGKCAELVNSQLFRPPYGRIKSAQIRAIRRHRPDMDIIMWDVLSGDYDPRISVKKCIDNVVRHTRNGSILVFHDSLKAFPRLQAALPPILEALRAKGFTFSRLESGAS